MLAIQKYDLTEEFMKRDILAESMEAHIKRIEIFCKAHEFGTGSYLCTLFLLY